MAAQFEWMARAADGGATDAGRDREARVEADWQAWLDERAAAAMAAQDDAEVLARQWGPEPEFMLSAEVDHAC